MTLTNPAKSPRHRVKRKRLPGPRTAFLGVIAAVAVCWAVAPAMLKNDLVIPTIVSLLFVIAAAFAAVASWQRGAREDVTYWDVAGAIVLIGVCASALIAPDQVVRIIAGAGEN